MNKRLLKRELIVVIFLCPVYSCTEVVSCEMERKDFSEKDMTAVITDKGPSGREVHFQGTDPMTRRLVSYYGSGGFYIPIYNAIEIGDTLSKHKGQTRFLVKKKDFDVAFEYICVSKNEQSAGNKGGIKQDTLQKSPSSP